MSDPVDTLPAEYRTESLRSLPGDLKTIAVQNIRKKFGITATSVAEGWNKFYIEDLLNDRFKQEYFLKPSPVAYYGVDEDSTSMVRIRRFRVVVASADRFTGLGRRTLVHVDINEEDTRKTIDIQYYVEKEAYHYMRNNHPDETCLRVVSING
jgi:hypothetical protein